MKSRKLRLREAKRHQNGGQEAPQERPREPKRVTRDIGPGANGLYTFGGLVLLKGSRILEKAAMLAADCKLQDWKDWRISTLGSNTPGGLANNRGKWSQMLPP